MRERLPALPPHPGVWRGHRVQRDIPAVATGHPRLDRELPGGGWPTGALTELLLARPGLGELSLLLPALAALTAGGRCVVLVDPPWTPYPPALHGHGLDLRQLLLVRTASAQDSLWACEQALRGTLSGAVLAWPGKCGFARLRRLQLAARANRLAAFLFRPAGAAGSASPAALRVHLEADDHRLQLTLLKGSGIRPGTTVRLHRQHAPVPPGLSFRCPPEAGSPGEGRPKDAMGPDQQAGRIRGKGDRGRTEH